MFDSSILVWMVQNTFSGGLAQTTSKNGQHMPNISKKSLFVRQRKKQTTTSRHTSPPQESLQLRPQRPQLDRVKTKATSEDSKSLKRVDSVKNKWVGGWTHGWIDRLIGGWTASWVGKMAQKLFWTSFHIAGEPCHELSRAAPNCAAVLWL